MKKKTFVEATLFVVVLVFAIGCTQAKDFSYGVKQITALNSKYNTTIETYPKSLKQIDLMVNDYQELKKLKLDNDQEQFDYVVDYRILNLEAERLYIDSQKYGMSGTTKNGFGCKIRPLITESVYLRNSSSLKGFKAVDLLEEFVKKYPNEANVVGLSLKNALFLNATFYQIEKDAKFDSSIINNFCPENVTLELYQQEFIKESNLSEDFIKSLSYQEAVKLWKEKRGVG